MIKEALEFIASEAVEASGADPIAIVDPRAEYFFVKGAPVVVPRPKPRRDHVVKSLDDLIGLAIRFGEPATVWHAEDAVIVVIDDDGHRVERVRLPLAESDTFKTIRGLRQSKAWLDHKSFCRLLRLDLANALTAGSLLNVVKEVRFDSGVVVSGKLNRTQESLGRDISSAVSCERDIPEQVTLTTRIYSTQGVQTDVRIRADVDVDPGNATFRLIPIPDEIETAFQYVMNTLNGYLNAALPGEIPCYYGTP